MLAQKLVTPLLNSQLSKPEHHFLDQTCLQAVHCVEPAWLQMYGAQRVMHVFVPTLQNPQLQTFFWCCDALQAHQGSYRMSMRVVWASILHRFRSASP